MSNPVAMLQDLADCRDKALVGGKAANLGQLIRAGFPVPGGFVVTTAAYQASRGQNLADGALPLADEIRRAWRNLGSVAVAVRSSATAEDMADASMAGQYDTFLDITDEPALLVAIDKCWASLDSPRTRTYLAEHGIDLSQLAMAVVVQKLVPADVAGVMFSANPRTGSREEMLIEASWGLGEAVVSGQVQPDVLRLDRQTGRVLAARIADKQVCIVPGNHQARPVEEGRRHIACLHTSDVNALWQLARRAVDYFKSEQDMEWAIHNGQLFLLQSRPITTLEYAEAYENLLQSTRAQLRSLLDNGRGPWVPHNIGETLKHPTPLTWSIIRQFMSGAGGFGKMYKLVGFEPSAKACSEGFLQRIGGKAYMDLSLAAEMFFEGYPFKYDPEQLRNSPDAGQSPPTVPAGTLMARVQAGRRVAAVNQKVHQLAGDLDRQLHEQIIPQFVAWCRQEKGRDLAALSVAELIDLFRLRQQEVMDVFAPQSLLPSMVSAMALAELRAFLDENFWDEDPDALAALLAAGYPPDKTVLANAELYEVACGQRMVGQWLGEHGHRAPDEFDLATPRWREQPQELATMADRLKDGVNPLDLHRQHTLKTQQMVEDLRNRLGRVDRLELDERIALTRRYMGFREDGKYYLMLGYELLRETALEAGRRLEIGNDVFQLSVEELFDALRVGFAPSHLIGQRKITYDAERRLALPAVIDAAAIATLGEPAKVQVAGSHAAFAVSSGFAVGPARIVYKPQEAGELGRGYILVCPSTDPAWTPLFVNAAGLVLECGGTLSHGAVIAREMSIAAVVLPGATALFQDGEMVAVDGRNGLVSRADAAGVVLQTTESQPSPDDCRIGRELSPPPAGRRERAAGRLRRVSLVVWGVYLAAAFLLPGQWVYQPTMALLDWLLWPLVRSVGKPGAVMVIAAGMAALTMVGQRLLTDNTRLRRAKQAAAAATRQAEGLAKDSKRRRALMQLAGPVQLRVVGASLVPLAFLLGPMVMIFMWLPSRVDPAAWNASPGTNLSVVATVDSALGVPVTLSIPEPLKLEDTSPASVTLPAIRAELKELLAENMRPSDLSALPWEAQRAAILAREEYLADLNAFLDHVPPQKVSWRIGTQGAVGRFRIVIQTDNVPPLVLHAVLGDQYPPGPTEVFPGAHSPLISAQIVYSKPPRMPVFWAPLAVVGLKYFDLGWMMTYLLSYLPVMFGMRWVLKVV